MSRKKGQTYTAEQKTKIVLEMLRADVTINRIQKLTKSSILKLIGT